MPPPLLGNFTPSGNAGCLQLQKDKREKKNTIARLSILHLSEMIKKKDCCWCGVFCLSSNKFFTCGFKDSVNWNIWVVQLPETTDSKGADLINMHPHDCSCFRMKHLYCWNSWEGDKRLCSLIDSTSSQRSSSHTDYFMFFCFLFFFKKAARRVAKTEHSEFWQILLLHNTQQ